MKIEVWVRSERVFCDLSHRGEGERTVSEDYRASGTLKKTKDGYRVLFSEEGDSAVMQIDTYADGTVSVNRTGAINTHMVFCENRVPVCICDTGLGKLKMQLRIRTKSIENTLTATGGKLEIEYSVEIAGNLAERNRLGFSVSPDRSIITS